MPKMSKKNATKIIDQKFQDFIFLLEDITENDTDRGVEKRRDCPICDGVESLHYVRATSNGHIHAYCESCFMRIAQ